MGLEQVESLDGSDKSFLYSLELIVSLDRLASGYSQILTG